MPKEFKAVVLAAGKGLRMRSDRPKLLHQILGLPLIFYTLETVEKLSPGEIYVVIAHNDTQMRSILDKRGFILIEQREQQGTADALLCCKEALGSFSGDLLVLAADMPLISFESLTSLVQHHQSQAAECTLLYGTLEDPGPYGRLVYTSEGYIAKIVEESEATPQESKIKDVNAGVYMLRCPRIFEILPQIRPLNKKGEYFLTDAIQILAREGGKVRGVRVCNPEEMIGVNERKDLVTVTTYLRQRIISDKMRDGVTILDPDTTYIESDVEIGKDTVIHPFTVIRRGVRIGNNCEVGPFAHLRAGTVLEDHAEIGNYVEVKKSRLGRHSKAKHLTYLGDAIIGSNVNIGAGTITANYDGRQKHQTIIEDGASTGSGTVLVAPVRMGKGSQTGAGAVVTKRHDVAQNDVVVGIPARSLKQKAQEKEITD
jgi:bifunctional UDP-N-acetylglucosamine pyrophosphorylase/glucosamine-1-phosphate N-acetyltransferase